MLRLPQNLHLEAHAAPRLLQHLRFEGHKVLPGHNICTSRQTNRCACYEICTKCCGCVETCISSAQSAAPAMTSATEGAQSAAPAAKSAHQDSHHAALLRRFTVAGGSGFCRLGARKAETSSSRASFCNARVPRYPDIPHEHIDRYNRDLRAALKKGHDPRQMPDPCPN